MKFLIVLAAYIALCAGCNISTTPGNNSHYVEGESRYIWIPDGEGVAHLVDLEAPVNQTLLNSMNGDNNQYWLYTRDNPDTAQIIVYKDIDTIWYSNFNVSQPLICIVHGWNSDGTSKLNPLITSAFLNISDANVIVVDWSALASSNYISATNGVPSIGEYLGNFLVWLIDTTGGDWDKVHLVGHSLGAHVVGNAGRTTGSRPARITGLDPAGPLWGGNTNALNSTDAQYVEAIHTDGGVLGIFDPIGRTNFYPHGGRNPQPDCWISTCSHRRAYELFAASVQFDNFVANQCESTSRSDLNECSGDTLNMGNSNLTKQGTGIYSLDTGSSWPYYE